MANIISIPVLHRRAGSADVLRWKSKSRRSRRRNSLTMSSHRCRRSEWTSRKSAHHAGKPLHRSDPAKRIEYSDRSGLVATREPDHLGGPKRKRAPGVKFDDLA